MSRISEIHLYSHELPIVGPPYKMALQELTSVTTILVEAVTENGLRGYGETCPLGPAYQPAHAGGAVAAIKQMAPHLIGQDALAIGVAGHRMDQALAGHGYAKAAVDMALWDLAGKQLGVPVSTLLGGVHQAHVPSYYAISVASPDEVARQVKDKQAQGFRRLQIKVGGRELAQDIAVAHRACEAALAETKIVLDANRSLTGADAIRLSQACRDLPLFLEQPCDTLEEHLAIKPSLCHPLILDECAEDLGAVSRAIHAGIADGFGMKLTRVGGISAMRAVRDLCQQWRRPISCDDSWGGDLVAAACAHVAATVRPQLLEGAWIAAPYIAQHYDTQNPVQIMDGQIKVPTGPGLGVVPDTGAWSRLASFG